jgi:hypothetical protein
VVGARHEFLRVGGRGEGAGYKRAVAVKRPAGAARPRQGASGEHNEHSGSVGSPGATVAAIGDRRGRASRIGRGLGRGLGRGDEKAGPEGPA